MCIRRLFKPFGVSAILALLVLTSLVVANSNQMNQNLGCTLTVTSDTTVQSASQSIQVAVNEAPANALICLLEGTYQENVRINRDDLTLKGQGPDKTVITGSFTIQGARRVSIEAITVKGGAFGIKLEGGDVLTVKNSRIEGSSGKGIELMHVGLASLENNIIQGHSDTGVLASLDSIVRLEKNQILKNGRDGVEIAGSKADFRTNQINDNAGCGVRADVVSTVTGRGNEVLRNTEKNLCGSFLEGFLATSTSTPTIAVLDDNGTPSYLEGRVKNSVEAVLQIARDRGFNARKIAANEIAAGELDAFTVLVMPDSVPPVEVIDKIVAWWSKGNHLIALDSAVSFILNAGILFPELRGRPARDSKGSYWDYASSGTIVIRKEHPITSGFNVGQELPTETTNALLTISKLPSGAEVLATDKSQKDQAAIVFYKGAGVLTFIGPDENAKFLKAIIGNAMGLAGASK
ncbi:right-handed parallel beta-helix repeat-containing protein [Candidatus Acetothermia bacterium]|nr:right-handed parallel beta-helix repeat-containing protein [Candidatus Acetothermia bacterium]MBI3461221.1 right-handed parallel beta-helix repeat-containing protein [Candidatus Acetothermia bacterium]